MVGEDIMFKGFAGWCCDAVWTCVTLPRTCTVLTQSVASSQHHSCSKAGATMGWGMRASERCHLLFNPENVSHSTTEKAGGQTALLGLMFCRNFTWLSGCWGWRYHSSHDVLSLFLFFCLHCTYCFHLNNNPPVTQHSQKNQTRVSEKAWFLHRILDISGSKSVAFF